MELILATADGREERIIENDIDFDIGEENDFEMTCAYSAWEGDIDFGKRLYIPGTEYGGIVKSISSSTDMDTVTVSGYTWRGYLEHRIIEPPTGEDYRTVSGELNTIIRSLIDSIFGGLIVGSEESTGVTVSSFRFDRYTTVAAGLTKMLASVGYKLKITYTQTDLSGYAVVSAEEAETYGDEFSSDSKMNYESTNYKMGINHLICLGEGELSERVVVHLYTDGEGNISQTQTFTGIEEIAETYINTNVQEAELIEYGTDRLKEVMNYKRFDPVMKEDEEEEIDIGDTVTGRDYITGIVVTKPITRKIVRIEGGIVQREYRVEGEE